MTIKPGIYRVTSIIGYWTREAEITVAEDGEFFFTDDLVKLWNTDYNGWISGSVAPVPLDEDERGDNLSFVVEAFRNFFRSKANEGHTFVVKLSN